MNILDQKAKKLETLLLNITEIIRAEAIDHKEFIELLNRVQLRAGEKADGSDMPDYAEGSKQPQAPGKIQLFDTGDFHDGIAPIFGEYELDMVGFDVKTPLLVKRYGAEILGLTKESQEELAKKLMPGIIRRIKLLIE